MRYPFPSHRIHDIVNAPKCVREGETFEVKSKGEHGAMFDVNLDLVDAGPFSDPRYLGNTHDQTNPEGYKANLLLAAEKVRGVDFHAVGQRRFYKQRIPAGWHQDLRDPNLPTTHDDHHRREALPDFAPTDFKNFIGLTAALWNIDLAWEESML
jgi:hypothetical protein